MDILESVAADKSDFAYCRELAKHIDLVATVAVRNVGDFTIYCEWISMKRFVYS